MERQHDGHRARLRQRMQREGLDSFQPHEVIELLLFYAIPVRNVNHLAHGLIDRFGSVGGVLSASKEELQAHPGIGESTADWLISIRPLLAEYNRCRLVDRPQLTTFKEAVSYASRVMPTDPAEQFWVIGMTQSGHLLCSTQLAYGAGIHTPDLRLLVDFLIRHNAQTAILAQRRLARDMEVAEGDVALVARLERILGTLRIHLMDSMLVCGHRQVSMRKMEVVKPARRFSVLNEGDDGDLEINWLD